jgi:hypothetical protein
MPSTARASASAASTATAYLADAPITTTTLQASRPRGALVIGITLPTRAADPAMTANLASLTVTRATKTTMASPRLLRMTEAPV